MRVNKEPASSGGSAVPVELALSRAARGPALTEMQRPLWASQRLFPDSALQNTAHLAYLDCSDRSFDAATLSDAFAAVVAASDVLRTRITSTSRGEQVDVSTDVAPSLIFSMNHNDTADWAAERAKRPLDLAVRGYDSVIINHEDGSASWYLNLHHVVTDATSTSLVFEATARAYQGMAVSFPSYYARTDNHPADLGKRSRRAQRFWNQRQKPPVVGQLYQTPPKRDPANVRIFPDRTGALAEEARRIINSELKMLTPELAWTAFLMTATAAYLHRLTGSDQFALGMPVHNRATEESRSMVGPLMTTVPVDVEIRQDDTFGDLHGRIAKSIMTTLTHSLSGVAPGGADCDALVNVIPGSAVSEFAGFPMTTQWLHPEASDPANLLRVQLTRYASGSDQILLDVNQGAMGTVTGELAAAHFSTVLEHLTRSRTMGIGEFSLTTGSENLALAAWGSGAEIPLSGDKPLVAEQLKAALGNNAGTALEEDGRSWTGPELWDAVAATASWIRQQGVDRGDRVGIEIARSAEAVVAIFATLVAGGSYVPLDPAQPRARLDRLAQRAGCDVVLRSIPEAAMGGGGEKLGPTPMSPEDEAYLLFTSGSTGEPKGVPITQGGLADYLAFAADTYRAADLNGGRTKPFAPLFSALTFDLTVTSLFVPLLQGGTLLVIGADGLPGLRQIAATTALNWAKATPSHLELVLRLLPENHELRTLVVGGEAFPSSLGTRLAAALPGIQMFNEYGPTEAVVGCMIHLSAPHERASIPEVPIGRPIPGVNLRILDQYLQPVPVGATGELCISSRGLTSGYLGDPESDTSSPDSRFVELDGARFYRSGDLVRLLDQHTLTYMGRVDEQIKVGGIRLDPIEVEVALGAHPALERAAVRVFTPIPKPASQLCVKCGLPSNVPGATFNDLGVCGTCESYEQIRAQAEVYFKTPDDLRAELHRARAQKTGPYDCLHLLSGGKDSTYALYQLVEMGFNVFTMTLDNGFISEGAKENVRKSVAELGVEHRFMTSDVMNDVFKDSLERHSNVCHGCYKTIYTLATDTAAELGIPLIVTGLSRGQLFETRLIPQQFRGNRFDPDAIDRAVLEARRAYHRADDGTNRLLDTSVFNPAEDGTDIFNQVRYLDFFRYVDVELSEMYRYLDSEAPWVRPQDTGRSTNCLINAAGIHNHLLEQGFHNYAIPYAWDVRLGHKTRAEAIDELNDQSDLAEVQAMLDEVGHTPHPQETLTAWLQLRPGHATPEPAELRSFLANRLPAHAIPAAFVMVDDLPVTSNGKLDTKALPAPDRVHRPGPTVSIAAESELERACVRVFERVLRLEPVGVTDDFFALGGDSLGALEATVLLSEQLGVTVPEDLIFSNPTVRDLAALLPSSGESSSVVPDTTEESSELRDGPPELTPAEEAMLFSYLNDPGEPTNNVGRSYVVQGAVDPQRLTAAVHEVVDRHPALHWSYGFQRKRLAASDATTIEIQPNRGTDAQFAQRAEALHRAPFDLENGPLLRVLLQPLSAGTTGVAVCLHHICTDETGFDVLWNDLDRHYTSGSLPPATGASEPLTSSADLLESKHFWDQQTQAAGAGNVSLQPLRPSHGEGDGYAERKAAVSLSQLRVGAGQTPASTSLAALAATLRSRADADADQLAIGVTVSTRGLEQRDVVGLHLNTLPLILNLPGDSTFMAAASSVASTFRAAYGHRRYPLANIVGDRRAASQLEPDLRIMFAYGEMATPRLSDFDTSHRVLFPGTAVADATFFVQARGEELNLAIEFKGAALDSAGAEDILKAFDMNLLSMVETPGDTIIQKTSAPDTGLLEAPPSELIHHGFLKHAADKPLAVAVSQGSESLTYGELASASGKVAASLHSGGVGPGDFVGIVAHRSLQTVVGILGILRSGAAYVPIDPEYPEARKQLIVEKAGISLILDDRPVHGTDSDANPWDDSAAVTNPDHPAYVIFTSGSTGQPKGVVVRHRNIVDSTRVRNDVYGGNPESFLLLSSFAFDSSMVGLFWPLWVGGAVVLPEPGTHMDVPALGRQIREHGVTHILALPALYRVLLTEADLQELRSLRSVTVAGEACPASLVAAHYERLPHTDLHNEYGPTECTVWSHHFLFPRGYSGDEVPIGHAIPGTLAAVIDESGQPVPVGTEGELVLAGAGLTAGYVSGKELTNERFVSLAALGGSASLWYRTGDRVKERADGNLVFLGRIDQQLKIRGFRVEPGEVEAALLNLPSITAAAVGLEPGRNRLVAWISGDGSPDFARLQSALRLKLPDYMVPTVFVQMDRLPVGPNGKTDRSALEYPLSAASTSTTSVSDNGPPPDRPLTETEQRLAEAWTDALDIDQVGIHQNYFDLGGDSIVGIKIVARLHRHGLHLKPRHLFEHQTIAQIAPHVVPVEEAVEPSETPPQGEVPLLPIQRWFFKQDFAKVDHWNQSLWLDVAPDADLGLLAEAAQALPDRHDMLRARYTQDRTPGRPGGADLAWVQTIDPPGRAIPVQRFASGTNRQAAAEFLESQMDITEGSLIQIGLFEGSPTFGSAAFVSIHHLVIDGVSWAPLIEDWTAIYENLAGKGSTPTLRTTPMKAWAQTLEDIANSQTGLDREYWQQLPTVPGLGAPTVADATERNAARHVVSLKPKQTTVLVDQLPNASQSVQEMLIASFAQAVCEEFDFAEFGASIEGHGREEDAAGADNVDLSRTVGWFTTQYPIRVALAHPGDHRRCLLDTQEALRRTPNRGTRVRSGTFHAARFALGRPAGT